MRSNILQILLAVEMRMGVRASTTNDAEYDNLEANALTSRSDKPYYTTHKTALAYVTKAANMWPCFCRQPSALSSTCSSES